MSGRTGIVFISEDLDEDDLLVWSGRLSACWESCDGASCEKGPQA